MNFLKKMNSREMVEMSLKTIMAVLACLVLIIFMEGMIYSIYMNKISAKEGISIKIAEQSVAYCQLQDDGKYDVYIHNFETNSWTLEEDKTKASIEETGYHKVEWRKPNAFDVSINGSHYIVMAVVIVGIIGFYGWRFYKINQEYKGFEKKYNKTGKIF